MAKENIKILAIESSCDETAAAVVGVENGQPILLSNVISSQIDLHAKTGGVVPEVASRAHMEAVGPVIIESLDAAKVSLDEVTHIAVTAGPGLIGSLLVGFNAAKSLAYAKNLPIIPVNHIEGHIYSAFQNRVISTPLESTVGWIERGEKSQQSGANLFPLISLTVSGGHTSITLMKEHGVYEHVGSTIDDAVGEAYDKVAKLLNLGYPGGPIISKFAEEFRNSGKINNIVFPRPIIHDGTYNFSFSGLKTAVLQKVKDLLKDNNYTSVDQFTNETKQEIAAAFEEAVADVLCFKIKKALIEFSPKALIFAGGVSANSYLRGKLKQAVEETDSEIAFLIPESGLFGDNAAMIAMAAYYHISKGDIPSWNEIKVDSNWDLV